MAITISDVLGAILILAGLYLVITGLPSVSSVTAAGGIIPITSDAPMRVKVGIALILIRAVFLKVDIGPLLGSGGGPASSPLPTST